MSIVFDFGGMGKAKMTRTQYQNNGATALLLTCEGGDEHGEPFSVLTLNVPSVQLQDDEVLVKTYSEHQPLVPALLESGVFTRVRVEPVGMAFAEVWKLNIPLAEIELAH